MWDTTTLLYAYRNSQSVRSGVRKKNENRGWPRSFSCYLPYVYDMCYSSSFRAGLDRKKLLLPDFSVAPRGGCTLAENLIEALAERDLVEHY